jgi:beta-lactamase class C
MVCGFLSPSGGISAPPATELPPKTKQGVTEIIEPWKRERDAPAVVVVVRQNGVTGIFPFGEAAPGRPVTADSIFELASVTKVFTATSLAFEVRAKAMQLEDPVTKYLPELANSDGGIRRVNLQHLATHTSGLPRAPAGKMADGEWTPEKLLDWTARWKSSEIPGRKAAYSNIGVGLLGMAIAAKEKSPLMEVWQRQFLNPLGMEHTFFEVPAKAQANLVQGYSPAGRPVPPSLVGGWPAAGRLKASARDMAAFLTANMGERPDRPRVQAAMRLAQLPVFEASNKITYGFCWQLQQMHDEALVDKNGGLVGTATYIGFLPERHVGVVILVNRGKSQATALGRRLLFELVGKKHDMAGDDDADE